MKLSTLLLPAAILAAGLAGTSALADCPAGTELYARGWSIPTNTSNQYAHAQIWNRSTDRSIYLQSISVGSNAASDFSILTNPRPMIWPLTHYGAGDEGLINGAGQISVAGSIRGEISLQVTGGVLVNAQVQTGATETFSFSGFVIPPGRGVFIRMALPNKSLRFSFSACE